MTARALARAFTKFTSRIRPKFWTGCPRCFLLVVIHVLNVCPSDMIWIKLITLSALLLRALATLRSAQVGDYADACAPWRPLRHQMWTRDPCLHRSVSKHGCPRRIRETEKGGGNKWIGKNSKQKERNGIEIFSPDSFVSNLLFETTINHWFEPIWKADNKTYIHFILWF